MTLSASVIHRSDLVQLAVGAMLMDAFKCQALSVSRYTTLEAALPAMKKDCPALVVIADQPSGIETARSIRALSPQIKQIVIGTSTDCHFIGALFHSGVSAYLHLHDSLMTCFQTAVRLVQRDRTYLSPLVSADYKVLVGERRLKELDSRAINVLLMLIEGHSVNEIMDRLIMSQDAVYRVRARLRLWFGVETNEAVIERAIAQGFQRTGGEQ